MRGLGTWGRNGWSTVGFTVDLQLFVLDILLNLIELGINILARWRRKWLN